MPDVSGTGRVAVLTGASSGFGRGVALELASRGWTLILAARRKELLDELAIQCESSGGRALSVRTDVSVRSDVRALAEQAVSTFGHVDVWLNDAGVGVIGRFEDAPLEDYEQLIGTNVLGVIYGSYAAIKQFKLQGSGTLINVASALGKITAPYYAVYAASKHAVVGLGAALRQELELEKLSNVHVCTVMPMACDTPFFEHAANYTGKEAAPIPPVYEPQRVIETIVRMIDKPEDEVVVGTAGKLSVAARSVMPGAVDSMMGGNTRKAQFDDSHPPAPPTSGAVHQPVAAGTGVEGGWSRK